MLLHEILARTRMREDQQHASQARLASRLAPSAGGSAWPATPIGKPVVRRLACSWAGAPTLADAVQSAKPGCQRSAIPRSGTVASSWHSTPNVPLLTRWISR